MKVKSTIVLVLFFLFSHNSFGQTASEYTDGVTKLITWFSDIDKILTNISDKEKLKRIYRQLDYASEDIDNIALGKLLLAKEISKLSNSSQQNELEKLKPPIIDFNKKCTVVFPFYSFNPTTKVNALKIRFFCFK